MAATKKRSVNPEQDHTEVLYVRVSPLIKEIIDEEAASQGVTLSQHIRAALVMDAVLNGNPKAAKLAFSSASNHFKSEFRALFNKDFGNRTVTE